MDKQLLKTTAQRLNVYDETVIKKAEECLRLYQSKASLKTLNDQTKIVLCLDLASHSLGNGFDKEVALKLCGLKKTTYQNSLNNLEKVLGLDKALTISDVCVQLGCIDIKEDAEVILNKYKKLGNKLKDLDHPQYVAAAAYMACKNKKISVDKQKIISISKIKSCQWKELINVFEKIGKTPRENLKDSIEDEILMETDTNDNVKKGEVEEVEDYEVWKTRILEEAYAALKKQKQQIKAQYT